MYSFALKLDQISGDLVLLESHPLIHKLRLISQVSLQARLVPVAHGKFFRTSHVSNAGHCEDVTIRG